MYHKIILIDDDDATNFYHKYLIEEHQLTDDIVVVSNVDNVPDTLNALDTQSNLVPSVLLLDISMPKYTGFELLELYYKRFEALVAKGLNVIILSTSNNPADVSKASTIPIVHTMWQKPLSIERLRGLVA